MHCSKCKQEGHNTRRCTWAGAGGTGDNGDDDDHGVAGDNGGIEGIDGNGGAASGNDGNVGRGWRTRRTRCGYCSELGHNSRRCMLLRGVQANVDPNTSRRVQERERRTVMPCHRKHLLSGWDIKR